jgi:hypothetical protein
MHSFFVIYFKQLSLAGWREHSYLLVPSFPIAYNNPHSIVRGFLDFMNDNLDRLKGNP